MDQLSKRQAEFWGTLMLLCIVVASIVLVIDLSIKYTIIEETVKYRRLMEGQASGHDRTGGTKATGNTDNNNNSHLPSDLVGNGNAGMETGDLPETNWANISRKSKGQSQRRRPTDIA